MSIARDALAHVPETWTTQRLKQVARINAQVLPEDTPGDFTFRYIDISSVDRVSGVSLGDAIAFDNAPSRARRLVAEGDVLVSTVRTYLRAISSVPFADDPLIASTGFAVIAAKEGLDPGFLKHWLTSTPFVEDVVARSNGVSYPATTATEIGKIEVPVPPLDVQRRIASFLDESLAHTDSLVREYTRNLDLLRERREALITSSTAEGEEIPFGFTMKRIRQGASPACEPFSVDGSVEWAVLKVGCSNSGRFDASNNKRLPDSEKPRPEFVVQKHEIVMSRSNTKELVGAAAVVERDYPRLMLSDLNYAISLADGYAPEYFALALWSKSARSQISASAKGTSPSMQKVSQRDVMKVRLRVPSLHEQLRIAAELRGSLNELERLQQACQQSVHLAIEHREALITAAVTGQINIEKVA